MRRTIELALFTYSQHQPIVTGTTKFLYIQVHGAAAHVSCLARNADTDWSCMQMQAA